ncbi:helix-turn-helix domain-containing protein [Ruminococcus sp. 5_1_39BFAA]|uniref:helix-turn-helix domain-containing protein n=1 Tax=Ruminococcus sp. 5_1_39BFAA TaxID=457412 RepID=UPI003566E6DB
MSSILQRNTYLKRVVLVLVFFTIVICIPYAATIYNTAQGKVLSTIQNANDQSLQQIKYNYTVNEDTMANLCMSIYYDHENQGLLYNSNISYAESGQQMRDMKATILAIYPSIYEVSIYNGSRNELYSTRDNQLGYFNNTTEFIENVQEIPKLQPILRRVPYAGTDNYIYVFSYFFYEYTDAENKPSSYVLVEQNANWLINNFTTAGYMKGDLPSRIYLVDKENNICSDTEVSDVDLQLLKNNSVSGERTEEEKDAVYYTDSVSGKEYLITRLSLNSWGDSLIMIQDYDQVLAELKSLQNTYWLIIGIWAVVYLVAIIIIGRHLYRPIDNLVKFINDLDGKAKVAANANEFSQIMELYKEAHEKLLDKNVAKQAFMRRYQFEKLLTDEKGSVWKEICSYLPEHWLVTARTYTLRVLKLKIQINTEQVCAIPEDDHNLYQFVVQNVLSELMEKEYPAEIFQLGDDSICGIVQASEGNTDLILEGILQETQQYAKRYMNISFCAAYSDIAESPLSLNAFYKQTDYLLQYSYVFGKGAIINSQLCKENIDNENGMYPESLERKLLAEVKCGNIESVQRLTEEIFDHIGTMRYENIRTCIMTLANNLNTTLKELYNHKGVLVKFQFDQIYHLIEEADYLEELETHWKEYIESALCTLTQKNEEDKGQIFVTKVQAYVEENYSDPNLSSHSVGDCLGLTGKYVMKKFQDYTGGSLNDYIYKVRMRKAAQLLISSNTPISKIAEQVGIMNENYFYRLFKKAYGCTPREFSKQNRQA